MHHPRLRRSSAVPCVERPYKLPEEEGLSFTGASTHYAFFVSVIFTISDTTRVLPDFSFRRLLKKNNI
jgi:hypothetical protein